MPELQNSDIIKNTANPFRNLRCKLALPARFERATFRLGGGRSILLSYGSKCTAF